ncbi:MAG: hypothetical protein MN733_07815 [Nitrososphaera sp.]|nr:hypothetical protein [Nitrososphaera sp.]
MDKRKKILIMGAGGCGSGFILGLLRACGLETGPHNEFMRASGIRDKLKAGVDPKTIWTPKVIKHLGGFLVNLNQHIDRHGWEVQHIFFAVASYNLQMRAYQRRQNKTLVEADQQYKDGLASAMLQLIERDHPFSMVRCPRSILDVEYCYDKLKVVIPQSLNEFKVIHASQIIPEKIEGLNKYE